MQPQKIAYRILAVLAVSGMVLGPAAPPVYAQDAGPVQEGPEVSPAQQVGALAWMQGEVSFHSADQDTWSPAVVNYPVTTGDGLWTQPGAIAGIDVANTLIAMGGGTELDAGQLQDNSYAFTVPEGEVFLHVRSVLQGENYTIITPRGTVNIATPGRYEIAAGTTQDPTLVTVLEGAAQVSGAASASVGAGQTAEITGDQAFQVQMAPAMHDAFLTDMLAREQPAPATAAAVPPVVQQMPGAAELYNYGSWSQSPDYGQVWYPTVSAGWQPYHDGQWAYVQPWGWTWVDNAPWGFAPFHYGRWVEIGGRWGWVPVSVAVATAPPVPCYAPALVTFFGIGAGIAVGAALLSGSVGWVPLGPREVYHPWFRASPTYVRAVNIHQVTNITNITNTTANNVTINNFRNAHAAVVVPAAAMATSRPIQAVARAPAAAQLAQARPIVGRPPVPPTTATAGVTPAVARQVHAVPPPAGFAAPARQAAAGPAITRAQFQAGHPVQPALRAAGPGGAATPAAVGRATPELRQPGRPGAPPMIEHQPGATTAAVRPEAAAPHAAAPEVRPAAPGVAAERHTVPALRQPGSTGTPPPIVHQPGVAAVRPEAAAPHGATPEVRAATPGAAVPELRQTGRPEAPPAVHAPSVTAATRPEAAAPHAAEIRPATPPAVREAAPVHPQAMARPVQTPHPAPRPEVHAAMPAPQVHMPAPQVHAAPPPAPRPEIHAAAPPPQVHMPTPQVHAAPPPAPRPEMRAAAPPPQAHEAPHPAPQQHGKRPGEP